VGELPPRGDLPYLVAVEATVESWARAYVEATTYAAKLAPPPPPRLFDETSAAVRLAGPGRGPEFLVQGHGEKSSGGSALRSPLRRARLVHTFLHHELGAAELMAWALLAFPDAPEPLRRGLVRILLDEVRHMNLYADYLAAQGYRPGSFPVRDWFWERIPSVPDIVGFLATMGIGFEGANLDHAARFAERFRSAGDEAGAALCERVGLEEVPHVAFALGWFKRLSPRVAAGEPLFEAFRASLPPPLSPTVMRFVPTSRTERLRAGLDDAFVDALEAWRGP
jgi:uncharacterized ferritin-like protein (DUF455 family)